MEQAGFSHIFFQIAKLKITSNTHMSSQHFPPTVSKHGCRQGGAKGALAPSPSRTSTCPPTPFPNLSKLPSSTHACLFCHLHWWWETFGSLILFQPPNPSPRFYRGATTTGSPTSRQNPADAHVAKWSLVLYFNMLSVASISVAKKENWLRLTNWLKWLDSEAVKTSLWK